MKEEGRDMVWAKTTDIFYKQKCSINSGNEEIIWTWESSSLPLSLAGGELQRMMACCLYGYTTFPIGAIGQCI